MRTFFLLRRAPSSFMAREPTSRVPPDELGHELRLSTSIRVPLSCTQGIPTSLDPKEGTGKGRGVPMSPHKPTSHLHSASPKAAEAARLLLSDMWASKELQGVLRQVRASPSGPPA